MDEPACDPRRCDVHPHCPFCDGILCDEGDRVVCVDCGTDALADERKPAEVLS